VPLALLALVAGHGDQGVSRDKLLAYLWPESDEARARNSLKQVLFGLVGNWATHCSSRPALPCVSIRR
jgi:hypothetical protein